MLKTGLSNGRSNENKGWTFGYQKSSLAGIEMSLRRRYFGLPNAA